MFDPGPLSARARRGHPRGNVVSHASGQRCASCHAPPGSATPMTARCLACHDDIRSERRDPRSLHGALPRGGTCSSCHRDHAGRTASLTSAEMPGFPHDDLGFSLRAHRRTAAKRPFTCRDCHGDPFGRFALAACDSCHRRIDARWMTRHASEWGGACLACHDGLDRFSRGRFRARAHQLPAHGCPRSRGVRRLPRGRAVRGRLAHRVASVRRLPPGRRRPPRGLRDEARAATAPARGSPRRSITARTAFPLTGAHVRVACAACHEGGRYRPPRPRASPATRSRPITAVSSAAIARAATKPGPGRVPRFDHRFPLTHGGHGRIACADLPPRRDELPVVHLLRVPRARPGEDRA